MVDRLGLQEDQIDSIVDVVLAEVQQRAARYVSEGSPDANGKNVILVDDGLATGYTMIAAARMVRQVKPRRLTLAVPVAPAGSLQAVGPCFDRGCCLIRQTSMPFAVASFYEDFPELTDHAVNDVLRSTHRGRV